MKIIYKSDDGKEFDTKEDCLDYERGNKLRYYLIRVFEDCYDYSEDAGFSVLNEELCVQTIIDNFEGINKLINGRNK